jgi:methionine-rich copper-binding protein CopC
MRYLYKYTAASLWLFTLFLTGSQVQAQPTITAVSPLANAGAVAPASSITVTFSQPLLASSSTGLKVFSSERGGLRTPGSTIATVSGRTLRFTPTAYPFLPGETIFTTITPAVISSSGNLARGKVFQFTAATGGAGRGNLGTGADVLVGNTPRSVALGDVDGDGDLDLLTADYLTSGVSVRLNGGDATGSNTGIFANGSLVTLGTNSFPQSVVVGDVDGDGDLDLLTTNAGTGTVSVRLNGGDATGSNTGVFRNGMDVGIGSGSAGLVVGDVDGDGDLDLLATTDFNNTVSVRLNGGDATGSNTGQFANGSTVSVGQNPRNLAIGDVDGDGDLDLLTTNNGNSGTGTTVSVRLNGGDATGSNTGVFSNGSTVSVGSLPTSITVGDVDGDGDLDLLTGNQLGNTVSVRLNGGNATGSNTGVFSLGTDVAVGNSPRTVVLSDVDGDGDLDLLTTNYADNTVSVRLNGGNALGAGTGSFSNGSDAVVGIGPWGLAVGDVDGDGDVDLLATNTGTTTTPGTTVSVRLNQAALTTITSFLPASGIAGTSVTLTGTNLAGATALTVNGISTPFLVSGSTALTFAVPAGTGNTQAVTVTVPGSTASSSAFTVLLKVTASNPSANAHAVPLANSALALTFSEPVTSSSIAPTGASGLRVYSAQVGGRKAGTVSVSGTTVTYTSSLAPPRNAFKPGEVVSVSVPATVQGAGGLALRSRVYQFTTAISHPSAGIFQPGSNPVVGLFPYNVTVGDVDGDGDLDFLVINNFDHTVSVRLNDGQGAFSGTQNVPVGNNPRSMAVADVDGDGDLDLLVGNYLNNQGAVSLLLNDGSGNFSGNQSAPATGNPYSMTVGDVDGDGDIDLLTSGVGIVYVQLNDGSGNFSNGQQVSAGRSPSSLAVGDLDDDGDLDLVIANGIGATGTVSIRLNDGSGNFSGTQSVNVGDTPSCVAVGDVDGDGDLDLLAANGYDQTVSVRLNDGLGTFSGAQNVAVGSSPYSLVVGDVDGDGDLDFLTGNYGGQVNVRLNNGAGLFSGSQAVTMGFNPISVALGDLDGDGDLDVLAGNQGNPSTPGSTVSVRLNGGTALATRATADPLAPLILSPNPTLAGTSVQVTGAQALASVSLLDLLGRVLLTGTTSGTGTAQLLLPSGLAAGVYLVRSGSQVSRLIID